jgi:ribosomal subunit interface protein
MPDVNAMRSEERMDLRVSGKNFDIGEALRQHVQTRVNAAIGKYFNGSVAGHVIVDHEGAGYKADCTLYLSSGTTLHSEGSAHDAYASFDQAAERLEKRLRRHKQRLIDRHGHANGSANALETMARYVLEPLADDHDEIVEFNPIIVAEKTAALKKISVSEAVIDLDLTGAPVVVFRHASSDRVNIVYRRRDGNIGWIDPAGGDASKSKSV